MPKEQRILINSQEVQQEAGVDDARSGLDLHRSLVGGQRLGRQDVPVAMVRRPEARDATVGRECTAVRRDNDLLRAGGHLGAGLGGDGRCSCRRGM